MNATAQTAPTDVSFASVEAKPAGERMTIMTKQLQEVQSAELRKLLDRQNELIERLNQVANINDVAVAERQRAIIEADLASTREEIAKRTENVGVMAAELMALYDELGLQAQKANADSPDDDVIRQKAERTLTEAMRLQAEAEAAVTAAQAAVTEAKDGWFPIGKAAKITAAEDALSTAIAAVEPQAKAVEAAKSGIVAAEAQIQVNRAERIRNASLAENFALVRQFTANAVTVLREDVEQTETRRAVTEKALSSALTAKATVARDLDATRDELGRLQRDLEREARTLSEIPDQGSEAYAVQQTVVTQLEQTLTEKRGVELKLNTRLISLTAAIEANKSSLAGLTTQRDTSEVLIIKLDVAEKTAAILGHNIDRMIKNTTQETASDALDRANDKMIIGSVELGIQAEVASAKARNDAIERHEDLMKRLHAVRGSGDQAMATEAVRYAEVDKRIRQGYAEKGIDLDMSHLQAAAKAFEERRGPAPSDATEVTY